MTGSRQPRVRVTIAALCACLSCLLAAACGDQRAGEDAGKKKGDLTVIFSSDLLGRIRSCGCAVEDMGGLGRRATYIEGVRSSVNNLIVVDAGDVFSTDLAYSQAEAELTFEAFDLMGLDAFTPGEIEFIFGMPFLKRLAEKSTFDLLAANVSDPETGDLIFGEAFTVRELPGGLRIGITGVLDDAIRFPAYIDRSTFTVTPVEEALRKVVPELKARSDVLVLLSHVGLQRSKALAQQFQDFDLVVVGHGRPVIKETEQVGRTLLLATGGEGQYLGRIDLKLDASGAYEYGRMQIVPLREEIEIHDGVRRLFDRYGLELQDKDHKKK